MMIVWWIVRWEQKLGALAQDDDGASREDEQPIISKRKARDNWERTGWECYSIWLWERERVKQSKACSCTVHKKLMLKFFIVFFGLLCVWLPLSLFGLGFAWLPSQVLCCKVLFFSLSILCDVMLIALQQPRPPASR